MADNLTPEARSQLMSRVKQKDTKPELVLRKALHAAGLRYVLHPRLLPGKPDIAFPKYRTAVFVHGCFWHGHDCPAGCAPSSNTEYWALKISANRERDRRKESDLEEQGWRVLTVWECETKPANLRLSVEALVKTIRGSAASPHKVSMR
ncbi:DNA mismatch endonuclease (patch repair protein) [Variovorax boronicumulans]|uniref:very short patch repair endonuclease n=1 Tax=Variovorax boronicumulans TaxID=436515 RepID=UPI002782D37A|nr:very short patch repair endonuclease [Variovorax boronicumulans]MDP9916731.1 DNA mismatch endonuclease (patch repair protein) [Variovorax boronicumulans]